MKIAIFCTGGTKLGFGHLFRSKTFVKAAPDVFQTLVVPVVDPEDRHLFNEIKHIAQPVDNENAALQVINRFQPDIVIFDTVYCSDEFFQSIKNISRITVSISPVFNQMNKIDYLFTRNINTPEIDNVKIYRGFEYAVFNENCRFIPDEIYFHNLSKEFLTVGIAMGGGDAPNKTLQVLQSICSLEAPCTFWILLGEGYKHSYQDLVTSIRKDSSHEIIMAKTNRSMWNVFSNCSVAILAGGLTTLEAVYAGLPTLNIFEKESHLEATGRQLFEQGVAENVGLFNDSALSMLKERLNFFSSSKSHLLQMRERSKGKIDKLGPFRIFEVLKEVAP
jgi:spore coat polysaccharide biosynthesis predicted glycosyltransferase SpsG